MTTTPDADVRAALDAAAGAPRLTLDPGLVLDRGHRAVRRRRVLGGTVGAAAAAVVAVMAAQLGTGQTRALPPAGRHTVTPAALSGAVSTGTNLDGTTDAPSVRLSVEPIDAARVEETWTIAVAGTPVKTIRREATPLAVGQASLLTPAESGDARLLVGYVNTGSTRAIGVSPVVTDPVAGQGGSQTETSGSPMLGGPTTVLFATRWRGPTPAHVVGLSWDEVRQGTLTQLSRRAVLTGPLPSGTAATVLRAPDGQQWLSWATADRIGVSPHGWPGGTPSAGALQLYPVPTNDGPEKLPDLLFGWVDGAAAPAVRSTDPADAWTVSDAVVGGRRAFLLTSRRPHFTGVLTVTAAGTSRSVDFTKERSATNARATDPGTTTTATP